MNLEKSAQHYSPRKEYKEKAGVKTPASLFLLR